MAQDLNSAFESTLPKAGVNSASFQKEVRKYSQISQEEAILLIEKMKKGDSKAKERLCGSVMVMIMKESLKYKWSHQYDDLVAEGMSAVAHAVNKYDPNGGSTWASFALNGARQAIRDYLRDKSRLIRTNAKFTNDGTILAIADYVRKHGELPEIGQELKTRSGNTLIICEEGLETYNANNMVATKIDAPVGGANDSKTTWGEIIPDSQAKIDDGNDKIVLNDAISKLPETLKGIVTAVAVEEMSYKDAIASLGLNISIERCRQLYNKGIGLLKENRAIQELV